MTDDLKGEEEARPPLGKQRDRGTEDSGKKEKEGKRSKKQFRHTEKRGGSVLDLEPGQESGEWTGIPLRTYLQTPAPWGPLQRHIPPTNVLEKKISAGWFNHSPTSTEGERQRSHLKTSPYL